MRILFQLPRLAGFLVLLLAFGLDQWSKARILAHADTGLYPHDVTSFFALVLVHNHGVSFGILSHMGPQAITLGTSLLAALLLVWLLRAKETSTAIALGLVVGGALGNILDRLCFGAVTDFLDFHLGFTHWPAFNIADSCIFIGVVILLLFGIVNPAPHSEGSKG